MSKHVIVYGNDPYSHMLAAIVIRYLRLVRKEPFVFAPIKYDGTMYPKLYNKTIVEKHKDCVWVLGDSLSPTQMADLVIDKRLRELWWFDYHTGAVIECMNNTQEVSLKHILGARPTTPAVGALLWKTLFPNEQMPSCIIWMDRALQGIGSYNENNFYLGLRIVQTDPETFTYKEDEKTFWDTCFENTSTVTDDESGEELVKRMQWDATYQVISVGQAINSYISTATWEALQKDAALWVTFPTHSKLRNPVLLLNLPDVDPDMFRKWLVGSTHIKYLGSLFHGKKMEITIFARDPEKDDCLEFAKNFPQYWGSKVKATFRPEQVRFLVPYGKRSPWRTDKDKKIQEETDGYQ